jgi:hypothetical protein
LFRALASAKLREKGSSSDGFSYGVDRGGRRPVTSTTAEQALNAALARMHIGASDDEYLEIVDRFYDEHVQVSRDATPARLIGRDRMKEALSSILGPVYAFARGQGGSATLRYLRIHADRSNEHHSAWSLELVGAQGRRVTVRWCVRRIWRQGQVVHEHFYENDMYGTPLTVDDLWTAAAANAPSA